MASADIGKGNVDPGRGNRTAQALIFALSASVALLADFIHNFGDALTAVAVQIAFWPC